MLLLKCPKCKHEMKYSPRANSIAWISDKSKRCMYCGRSFRIKANVKKKL